VLELEDLEDGAFDVDVVAVLELIGRNYGKSALSRFAADSGDPRSFRGESAVQDSQHFPPAASEAGGLQPVSQIAPSRSSTG
jgi:hypothetical protein